MIVHRCGGMTEFIPSVREKREGLIHDHILELAGLLHERLSRIEEICGLEGEETARCRLLLHRIRAEEGQTRDLQRQRHRARNGVYPPAPVPEEAGLRRASASIRNAPRETIRSPSFSP